MNSHNRKKLKRAVKNAAKAILYVTAFCAVVGVILSPILALSFAGGVGKVAPIWTVLAFVTTFVLGVLAGFIYDEFYEEED